MSIKKNLKSGFTLVELMIVVAIVGVLAVLAVYGVRKYIANAKTAEARNSLGQIGKDAITAFEAERMNGAVLAEATPTSILRSMCGDATTAVPANPPAAAKYQSSAADWANPADIGAAGVDTKGFPCLKFEMIQAQYYSYNYQTTGALFASAAGTGGGTFDATARGDLNGDGKNFSTFTMKGAITNGRLLVSRQSSRILQKSEPSLARLLAGSHRSVPRGYSPRGTRV